MKEIDRLCRVIHVDCVDALVLGRVRGVPLVGAPLDLAFALQLEPGDDVASLCPEVEVFHAETAPLADYYRSDGRLRDVEGLGDLDAVTARVMDALSGVTTEGAGA